MGGNALFNVALTEGGTLYIDDGRPMPGMIDETLRNLREISPTYYANVPAGYAALAAAMEKDDALCRSFFKNLGLLAYGGARLPDDLYDRFQALAVRTTGERFVFYTGWGSTETAPTSTGTYWDTERVGLIGLPFPGVELKMVPAGAQYELRLRGVNVTPGYYGQPELTQKAFDEEGFYCIGDAGVFVNPDDPAQGLIFSGRVVEDFKLTTGTFVLVGSLRTDAIAAASPVIQDALVAGQDRPFIGLLAWPSLDACRRLIGDMDASLETVVNHPKVRAHLRDGLLAHNKAVNGVSSMTIARAMLMAEPPSIDGNELTDKGYINQRAGLERRRAGQAALCRSARAGRYRSRIVSRSQHESNQMNFEFSEDQKQLRDQARRYLTEHSPPKAVRAVLEGKAPYDKACGKVLPRWAFSASRSRKNSAAPVRGISSCV
jgi:feruloyl-CoA synthase